jgi:hypothetical protein
MIAWDSTLVHIGLCCLEVLWGLRNGKTPKLSEFSAARLRTAVRGRVPEDPLQAGDRVFSASTSLRLIPAIDLIRRSAFALLWAAILKGGEKETRQAELQVWVASTRLIACFGERPTQTSRDHGSLARDSSVKS